MKRLTQVITASVLLALLLLLQPPVPPAEAQCLVDFPVPFVVLDEGNQIFEFPNPALDGVLPPDGGWYTEEVDLRWELTTQPHLVLAGCEDRLITYDTPGEVHSCTIDIGPGCNIVSNQVTVRRDATPPVVVTNLPPDQTVPVAEGATLTVEAAQSFDETSGVATIAWSLDGDNLFDDGNPAIFKPVDGLSGNEPALRSLVAQVVDRAGNLAEASFSVRIDNVPPSVNDVQTVVTEFGVDLTAGFTDPGVLDTHTATVDWGDGTVETGLINEVESSGVVLANHSYDKKGLYPINIMVIDKDGGTGAATSSAEVGKQEEPFFLSVPASLAGTFEHPHIDGAYRTLLNSVSTLEFAGEGAFAEARFVIDPAGCFGLAAWETVNATPVRDPAILCLTGLETLDLVVPFELTGLEPNGARIWTNPAPVTAQSFIRGCGASAYQPYGNLSFQPGDLTLTTSVDLTGQDQVSISANPDLSAVTEETWAFIRQSCAGADLLPPSAVPGFSLTFSGGTFQAPLNPDSLSGQFRSLEDTIGAVTFAGGLALKESLKLIEVLEKSGQRLQVDLVKGQHELTKFIDDVAYLQETGLLAEGVANDLITQALSVIERSIVLEALPPLPPLPTGACTGGPESCPDTFSACLTSGAFLEFHVNAAATEPEPDGSESKPFRTLTEALARAEALDACGVALLVAEGVYEEGDLVITRHTQIIGSQEKVVVIGDPLISDIMPSVDIFGSVTVTGPYVLELHWLKLSRPFSGSLAGVLANHPCARVSLNGVVIENMGGFGIRQQGGSLSAINTFVRNTVPNTDDLTEGSGIYLTCGVQTDLFNVRLRDNTSAGLHIADEGTRVRAAHLYGEGTRMHPDAPCDLPGSGIPDCYDNTAEVLVRDGAELGAEFFWLRLRCNNDQPSLLSGIRIVSGLADLEFGLISGSETENRCPHFNATKAVRVIGGQLKMSNFTLEKAPFAIHMTSDSEVDLSDGLIRNNHTAIFLQGGLYDLRRLINRVMLIDNRIPVETSSPAPGSTPLPSY